MVVFPETLGLESRKVPGFFGLGLESRLESLGFRDFFTLGKMLPTRKYIVENFNILTNFHRFRLQRQITTNFFIKLSVFFAPFALIFNIALHAMLFIACFFICLFWWLLVKIVRVILVFTLWKMDDLIDFEKETNNNFFNDLINNNSTISFCNKILQQKDYNFRQKYLIFRARLRRAVM